VTLYLNSLTNLEQEILNCKFWSILRRSLVRGNKCEKLFLDTVILGQSCVYLLALVPKELIRGGDRGEAVAAPAPKSRKNLSAELLVSSAPPSADAKLVNSTALAVPLPAGSTPGQTAAGGRPLAAGSTPILTGAGSRERRRRGGGSGSGSIGGSLADRLLAPGLSAEVPIIPF
jgi:hypothetical protein